MRYPTPPVFCKKRLQAVENKGGECEKERQEKQRGGNILKTNGLWSSGSLVKGDAAGRFLQRAKILGGNADGCENKGVAKIATQMLMKLRELKIDQLRDALRVAKGSREETGTQSAEPWVRDYRICYYLSSEKLKTVN